MRKSDAQHAVESRSHRLAQGAQRVEAIIDDPETLAALGRAIEAAGSKSEAVRLALRLAFPSQGSPSAVDTVFPPVTAPAERVSSAKATHWARADGRLIPLADES